MSTFTYKSLTALALAGALLAAPALAEDAHHPEQLAQNQQGAPSGQGMGQGMGMGMGAGQMDWSQMQEMMNRMHSTTNPQERQKIRTEHRAAMQSQMGMMRQRLQQSQCPMAKDASTQQQCLGEMHQSMQNMMEMMEQMLQNQSGQQGQ